LVLSSKVKLKAKSTKSRCVSNSTNSVSPSHWISSSLANLALLFRQSLAKRRYTALSKWTDALESVHSTVLAKTVSHVRGGEVGMGILPEGSFEGILGMREFEPSRGVW
jgi:glucan phosphorylase